MNLTLYYAPHTRAGRVRWLLEELGVPHELNRDRAAAKAVHPLGLVPTLVVDGAPMIESGAMLIYLADRFADRGLAPALDAPERAAYLQWILFNATQLEPPLVEAFFPSGGVVPSDGVKERGVARFHAAARVVAAGLGDREYVVGDRFSAADIAIAHVLGWARGAGVLAEHPTLLEYGRRLAARPAAKAARAD